MVELTVALHHCFDSPKDKLVWDVESASQIPDAEWTPPKIASNVSPDGRWLGFMVGETFRRVRLPAATAAETILDLSEVLYVVKAASYRYAPYGTRVARKGAIQINHWKTCEQIGLYTKHGLQLR